MPIDFPANPTNGQVYGNYIFDSSITAWRNVNTDTGIGTLNAMGLKNVVPTSVVVGSGSATTNSNGNVTFTGATSVSLNGCFNSTYRNYKVVVTFTAFSGTTSIEYRLRTAGTDQASGTNYAGGQKIAQNGGLGAFYNSATTTMYAGSGASTYPYVTSFSTDIAQPFPNSTSTTMVTTGSGFDGSVTFGYYFGGVQSTIASYDGLTLLCITGNFSGNIQVYGLTN